MEIKVHLASILKRYRNKIDRRVNRPAIAGRPAKRNQLGILFFGITPHKFMHLACFAGNFFGSYLHVWIELLDLVMNECQV